jgi:hypothetical protein
MPDAKHTAPTTLVVHVVPRNFDVLMAPRLRART